MTHDAKLSAVHRDAELDGLRGLAVAMVLAWHFIGIPAWATEGRITRAIFNVFLLGGAGVDLFFVLSGFLITRIVILRKESGGRFLLAFYVRRALRILPPYTLLLGIFWIVVLAGVRNEIFNDAIPLLRFLTFSQNFWMAQNATYGPAGISVTWSVAIEEQYYLVFPILALILPRRRLPGFLAIVGVGSIIWRAVTYAIDPSNNFPPDLGTLQRLDGLAAGGLIACAFQSEHCTKWLCDHRPALLRAMVWSLFAILILVRRTSGSIMAYYGHTLLTLGFALVIINVLLNLGSSVAWVRGLRSPGLRFLGKISYSLYLFHPLILAVAFDLSGYPKTLAGWPQIVLLTISLFCSIVFSQLLFRLFESRLITFGRKITY